jgi:hypothetical protein
VKLTHDDLAVEVAISVDELAHEEVETVAAVSIALRRTAEELAAVLGMNRIEHVLVEADERTEPERQQAVVAGPHGHWYAWHNGELTALPQTDGDDEPPPHPSESSDPYGHDGWYSPDDLVGCDRRLVLNALGVPEDARGAEPSIPSLDGDVRRFVLEAVCAARDEGEPWLTRGQLAARSGVHFLALFGVDQEAYVAGETDTAVDRMVGAGELSKWTDRQDVTRFAVAGTPPGISGR